MEQEDDFRRLLKKILVPGVPEPAARLKQRLTAAYLAEGLGPFDPKAAGFKRFKDYLRAHADLVTLDEGQGGDMVVSLRSGTPNPAAQDAAFSTLVAVRGEVWLAFSNPDEHRLRYLDRTTGRVIHFTSDSSERDKAAADSNLVQIDPAPGPMQSQWMKDFLEQSNSAELTALPLSSFVETDYRSSVNAAFTRALGRYADDWRTYRTARMLEHIKSWAAQAGIPMSSLTAIPDKRSVAGISEVHSNKSMSVRERAIRLLDGLTDEELRSTAIPVLLATLMVKSKS